MLKIDPLFPVCNAAGECKSVAEVERLARSAVSAIVVGSITLLPRDGNSGNTFNGNPLFGLNALGLPNPGIKKLEEVGPEMVRVAHDAEKPIIASIAGFTPREFKELALRAQEIGFDGVEINLGCPNVADGGKRKSIISYRPELVYDCLYTVLASCSVGLFVSVKVSPMDPERLDEIASCIDGSDLVDAVVSMNTVPNCLDFSSDGTPVINTPDKTGYAGGSGKQVFQQALGQVQQWRNRLPKRVAVWGVGGVQTGEDVVKMLRAGASVVQVGTAYFIGGAKVFGDIAAQFIDITQAINQGA